MFSELNNIQITRILENDILTRNTFIGVYPYDRRPVPIRPSCFILNNKSSKEQGEHWIAFFMILLTMQSFLIHMETTLTDSN